MDATETKEETKGPETKHTEGPWTAAIGSRGADIYVANIASHPLSFGLRWNEYDHEQAAEGAANARLIAASPDLLAAAHLALEGIRRTFQSVQLTPALDDALCAAKDALRDAIAKAEGKE